MRRGGILALGLLAAVLAVGTLAAGQDEGALAPGKAAPLLKAEGWLNGSAPTADALKGKVLVIDWFAFW